MAVRSARSSQQGSAPRERAGRPAWFLAAGLFGASVGVVLLGVGVWTVGEPPATGSEDLRGARGGGEAPVVQGTRERVRPRWSATDDPAPTPRAARAESQPSRPSTFGAHRRFVPGPAYDVGSAWTPGLSPTHCILYFEGRSRAGTSGTYWCRPDAAHDVVDDALRASFRRTFKTLDGDTDARRIEGPGARATWSHHRDGWMRLTLYQQSGDAAESLLFSAGLGLIPEMP